MTVDARAESLRGLCGGAVLLPGNGTYDAARTVWNLAVDQRPAAIAYPSGPAEVAAVVHAATRAGLRVAAQGTGHNAGPLGALHGVVLLRTSAMVRVRVDPTRRHARAQAGARWLEAVEAAGAHGLAALHGNAPSVGVVGYSLGGGLGWYARAYGQQANSVTAVEVVAADGSVVRADREHEPDLFWALRGGGGNFGIVTALEFALYPVRAAYAGMLAWDWRVTRPVLHRWADWTAGAPDLATTSFRILQIPPLAAVPAALRGRKLAVIDGAVLGDEARAQRLLAPLRALRPEFDTFTTMPASSVIGLSPDPREPTPVVADSAMLSALPTAAIEALVASAGPHSGSSLRVVELRQLGGALSRPDPRGGVLPVLDDRYLLFASTVVDTPEAAAAGRADVGRVITGMAPFTTGSTYLNFATNAVDVSTAYRPDAWSRLRAVRAAVDPDQVFLANHPVPPAES